jgi:hypothetical protein
MKPTGKLMPDTKSKPFYKPVHPDTSPFDHLSFLFYHIHISAIPGEAASG